MHTYYADYVAECRKDYEILHRGGQYCIRNKKTGTITSPKWKIADHHRAAKYIDELIFWRWRSMMRRS